MNHQNCPVKLTASIIGGKWKPMLLFYLEGKTRRFCELQRLIPGLTKKMLTQHLRELERDGIVQRKVFAEVPPHAEYSLTRHGESLKPILKLMSAWGTRHQARYGMTVRRVTKAVEPPVPDPAMQNQDIKPPMPFETPLPRLAIASQPMRADKATL